MVGETGNAGRGNAISAPFWRSVEEGEMKLPYCPGCERFFFYPRPFCPNCWSEDVEWRPVSGEGTVWSFSVVHFPFFRGEWKERLPYVVALIELEEGVRMLSNVVECPVEEVRVGLPVKVLYGRLGDQTMPLFRPAR